MSDEADELPITRAPLAVAAITRDGRAPSHQAVWKGCVDGKVPHFMRAGRYFVRTSDLPQIALTLGFALREPAPRPRRSTATAVAA